MAYREKFYIKTGSQGNAFDPPRYPTHKYHIENNKKTCYLSIDKDIYEKDEYSYIDNEIKLECKKIIEKWDIDKLPLDHDLVKDWIYQMLGYFKDCFKGLENNWNCDKMKVRDYKKIFSKSEFYYKFLVTTQSLHFGVHHIRKYYPEYVATEDDFENAYWGKPKLFKIG